MPNKKTIKSVPLNPYAKTEGITPSDLGFKNVKSSPFKKYDYSNPVTKRGTYRKGQYQGGRRESAQLSWKVDDYSLQALKTKEESELRKEYSRLRSIVRKRFERIAKNPEYRTHSKIYNEYKDTFVPLSQIKSESELRHLLVELSNVLTHKLSSASGIEKIKREFLKTMNDSQSIYKGIVNSENYWNFLDFMESLSDAGLKKMYDSKHFVEWFNDLTDKTQYNEAGKSLKESFESWAEKQVENFKLWKHEGQYKSSSEFFTGWMND